MLNLWDKDLTNSYTYVIITHCISPKQRVSFKTVINTSDKDECISSPCHALATCNNTDGSYTCACNAGYTGNGVNNCTGNVASLEHSSVCLYT